MQLSIFLIILRFVLCIPHSFSSAASNTLPHSSSLSVEKPADNLVSPNGVFSAGFFEIGDNAFSFAIWFTKSKQPTVLWMANRDQPVNGKASKLTLMGNGNLVLSDAGRITIWTTSTFSTTPVQLKLMNNGNLVLSTLESTVLWQSFDSPTDTLLPGQILTEKSNLLSSRSTTNYSSGFYKFYFDNDNVLRMLYKGPEVSTVYWPAPWQVAVASKRSTYNISKTASLDPFGRFFSSDNFTFKTTDYDSRLHRRVKIDPDGNLRTYSFNEESKMWEVTWEATVDPCTYRGMCGRNSLCTYDPAIGRTCYCLQGYKRRDPYDWSKGCEPEYTSLSDSVFVRFPNLEFYGYDLGFYKVSNLTQCQDLCLARGDSCIGIQFKFNPSDLFDCYYKALLYNGRDSPNFGGDLYLRMPRATLLSSKKPVKHQPLNCPADLSQRLNRVYQGSRKNASVNLLLWFACGVGALELICIFLVWFRLFRTSKKRDTAEERHLLSATGFQRFSYAELKKATGGFSEVIGRGGGGVVYKGRLCDDRVAAIKCLSEANQGEAEFLAEISTIGMLNHMNLIDMWGYCVEGKHRLLVYEYMEHGSLAENLFSNVLDWKKRYNIAAGTARGLAYLHEECLEWVLHCDVKPQNILLDSDFHPKVADFGLSKLLNRDERGSLGFSRIRGTRGYMAPEWVYNLRITSKVDVYSYGIVVLEMITGRSPMESHNLENTEGMEQRRLVAWIIEKISNAPTREHWIDEIADANLEGKYNVAQVELLVKVALQCVEDHMDARPSMSQVVEMLLSREDP